MNHRERKRLSSLIVLLLGGVLFVGFTSLPDGDFLLKIYKGIDVFGKVYKEVASNYVDEIDPDRFMRAGIEGMLKTLDPYTVYIDEREHDEIDLVTTGKYGGVGVTVGLRDGAIMVVGLLEGFSAAKHGIQIGDKILEIDGARVAGLPFDAVRLMVRGAPGTEIRMKIEREPAGEVLEFVLLREEIPVRNVSYTGFVSDGIGYIRLERFSRTAGDDVRMALKELTSQGPLQGLVLDLRDNPGGLLDMAVDVVAKFLPESSLVVTTKGRRRDADRTYYTFGKPMLPDVPLAVLVDGGSASASEIVAGAIQDLDRGIIVGTRTFGKGLVQTITRLSESTSLKITTGRYFTPSGRSIQEIDYFHRTEQGEVRVLPDSLRREFRTAHNRSVFEGGGIQPDSVLQNPDPSDLARALQQKALFFRFANRYASRHAELPPSFRATSEILKEFEQFARESGFVFSDDVLARLSDMEASAARQQYSAAIRDELKKLRPVLSRESEKAFQRNEKELLHLLTMEIVGRIRGDKERIRVALLQDAQLDAAVALVKGRRGYQEILSGTPR